MNDKVYCEFTLPDGDIFGASFQSVPQIGDVIVRGKPGQKDKKYLVNSVEWYPDFPEKCNGPEIFLEGPL